MVALIKYGFPAPPRALTVTLTLFGTGPAEQQFQLRATRNGEADLAILTPERATQQFFRGPGAVGLDYAQLGLVHLLQGPDHLLFLMTVIVTAAGWRYWLGVVTAFTLAHSITLAAALLGWLRLPATLVEPLVAASIVVMAALNLVRLRVPAAVHLSMVFACGLLHGLGFGAAMATTGLHGSHAVASLLGFNLGLEIGQLLFLLCLLLAWRGVRTAARRWRASGPRMLFAVAGTLVDEGAMVTLVSSLALLAGAYWLVQRLLV